MASLTFEIRNMETEERGEAEFPDAEAALTWLRERPQFLEVLGPVRSKIDPQLEASLRKAMRPLDPTELARRAEIDREREATRKAELRAMNDRAIADERPITGGQSTSSVLRWERGRGLWVEDDPAAPVPGELAAAALEWIRERDRWVHPRRQHVSSARLSILPLDAGEASERISDTSEFATMPGFSDHEVG